MLLVNAKMVVTLCHLTKQAVADASGPYGPAITVEWTGLQALRAGQTMAEEGRYSRRARQPSAANLAAAAAATAAAAVPAAARPSRPGKRKNQASSHEPLC